MYIRVRQYNRKGLGRFPRDASKGAVYYFEAVESYRENGAVKKRICYHWKSTETTIEGAIAQQERNIQSTISLARTFRKEPHQPSIDKANSIIETLKAVQKACPNWQFKGKPPEIKPPERPFCPTAKTCYFAQSCDLVHCIALSDCA